MSIKRLLFLSYGLILLGIVIGITVYFTRKNEKRRYLVLYGNVDVRQVDIGFRISGQVKKLFYEEGDLVKAGSLMAVLDKSPYDSRVRQAEARVESAVVKLNNAELVLKRRQELIDFGGVSQEDVDNALAKRNQLRAEVQQPDFDT